MVDNFARSTLNTLYFDNLCYFSVSMHFTAFHLGATTACCPRSAARPLNPVYAHSNPIFFEGGLQSTIIIFAKTNPFLPAVRDCGVMRANGGRAVITAGGARAAIAPAPILSLHPRSRLLSASDTVLLHF